MKNEPSGEYYDYTITMRPERPWLLPYHQTLIYRTFNCSRNGEGDMEEVFLNFCDCSVTIRPLRLQRLRFARRHRLFSQPADGGIYRRR